MPFFQELFMVVSVDLIPENPKNTFLRPSMSLLLLSVIGGAGLIFISLVQSAIAADMIRY